MVWPVLGHIKMRELEHRCPSPAASPRNHSNVGGATVLAAKSYRQVVVNPRYAATWSFSWE